MQDEMTETRVTNIVGVLDAVAAERPHQMAVIVPDRRTADGRMSYTHLTFQQLVRTSEAVGRGLLKVGMGRGTRTVLLVTPGLEFVTILFGMIRIGAVPVVIDPGLGIRNLKVCLAEAAPEAFIGVPRAHVARIVLGWGRETIKTVVTVGKRGPWGGVTYDDLLQLGASDEPLPAVVSDPNEMAVMPFTSGSTGVPKGVVWPHKAMLAQIDILRNYFAMHPGKVFMSTFAPFTIFGPLIGMSSLLPQMDFTKPAEADPRVLIEEIEDFGVSAFLAAPSLMNNLGRYCEANGITLPTIDVLLNVTGPMTDEITARMTAALRPDVSVNLAYGATECLGIARIAFDEIQRETRQITAAGGGVCVGRLFDETEAYIIEVTDEPIATWDAARVLPPGEVGEIVVRGPLTSPAYYNRERSNQLAKIQHPDGSVLHRMGDLGYFDAQGRLWVAGRKSHRVEIREARLFTLMVERIFYTHPDVFRAALVGVELNGAVEAVLLVELEAASAQKDREQIKRELFAMAAKNEQARHIKHILFHPKFPTDIRHNTKIFREQLRPWAAQQLGGKVVAP